MERDTRKLSTWLRTTLHENLSLDLRALALMRIAFGLLVIADVVARSADLDAHYSDLGWLPRANAGDPALLKAYFIEGHPTYVAGVMVATCVAAALLSLGFHARICAAICWFLLGSLHQRLWLVNQGGDDLMRNFLFFLIFTPLGARWSVDAWRRRKEIAIRPQRAIGATTVVLYGQLFLVYFITGTMKANHAHWWLGEAVYHALSAEHFATEFGQWLYPHWYVLKALTWGTLLLEICGPVLLVVGPPRTRLRGGLVIAFWCLHIGIALTLHVGIFSAIACACWLFTLPTPWMDAIEERFARVTTPPTWWRSPSPRLLRIGAAACFILVVLSAMVEDRAPKDAAWRKHALWPTDALGLKRRWALFIAPRSDRGWIIVEARLNDGTTVDLVRRGAPIRWAQPDNFYRVFENQRWRKMLMRFRSKKKTSYAQFYLKWVCLNDERIDFVAFHYMKSTLGERYDHGPPKAETRAARNCVLDRKRAAEGRTQEQPRISQ